jgi:hypothetical protein
MTVKALIPLLVSALLALLTGLPVGLWAADDDDEE